MNLKKKEKKSETNQQQFSTYEITLLDTVVLKLMLLLVLYLHTEGAYWIRLSIRIYHHEIA